MAEVTERDGQAQVMLSEAQLAQARAALEITRKKLRDAAILAPVGGLF
jgi:multidrug resistance efflux pump